MKNCKCEARTRVSMDGVCYQCGGQVPLKRAMMTDAELLELATSFALGDDYYLERNGNGWMIRYERPGTMNPYCLNALPAAEPWQYKSGTRFPTRRAALDCFEARGARL